MLFSATNNMCFIQDLKRREKELQAREAELNKREKVFCT
jgi:hypothetical protein